jgi:murein tripeptide amidase MpaA
MRCALILAAAGAIILAGSRCNAAEEHSQHLADHPQMVRYDGHRALRITARTPRELLTVLALTDDVLTCEGAGIGTFDVRFSPEQYAAFLETRIQHEILIDDLQAHIDAWRADNEQRRQQDGGWYEAFRDLQEIEARLDQLAAAHPGLATISIIGQSLEERPIRMIRITGPAPTPPPDQRPAIVINGTQHSRESLSPMVSMYFIEHLLTHYATDPRIQAIVDGIDFHIIPMVNPDGYEHVWNTDPMWRKNRRENPGSTCGGVDLNRNWGFQWGLAGSSGDPCSQTFRGSAAIAEPETQAIVSVIDALGNQDRLRAHLDIHSAAQRFLSPWGYSYDRPPDLTVMDYLGQQMADAIAAHRGRIYPYGPGSQLLYIVSGGARDYSYGNYGAMSWTLELSGPGFYPPASEIFPVSVENASGLLALAEFFLSPTPTGACCIPWGCMEVDLWQCNLAAGRFVGDGAACAQASCPRQLTTGAANTALTSSSRGGIFLDLAASQMLDVIRIDTFFNNALGTPVEFEIWTYPGSYVGNDASAAGWALHDTVLVDANGPNAPTPLHLAAPIHIASGQTTGIYILAQSGHLRYTRENAQPTWFNDDLTLFSDRARSQPWGGSLFSPRTFAGTIFYTVASNCYANCDQSTTEPILNVDDFICFIGAFAHASALPHEQQVVSYANCDQSTTAPVLNVDDFLCFINEFAQGCP